MIIFLMLKSVTASKNNMLWIVSQTRTAQTLPLKDLTILANSAIPTSSTRRRLLSPWKICSGTDPETEVLKMIRPYCQQYFETADGIEKHNGIHIMR